MIYVVFSKKNSNYLSYTVEPPRIDSLTHEQTPKSGQHRGTN